MKQVLVCLFAGLLFGVGLALSSMVDPGKVIDFLDVSGNWDPSLAFVMIGALGVTFITFYFIPKRANPIFDENFRLPSRTDIDKPLVLGSILFGIGWGMTGYCPGAAVSKIGISFLEPAIFVVSMIAGFVVQRYVYDTVEVAED